MEALERPLSNLQLELLKAFSHQLSEADLLQVKAMLAAFFADKSIEAANKVWDEQGWNQEKVDTLLRTKLRIPYKNR
jgi:hypothetical protein